MKRGASPRMLKISPKIAKIIANHKDRESRADMLADRVGNASTVKLRVHGGGSTTHAIVHRSVRPDAPHDKPYQVTEFGKGEHGIEPHRHQYVASVRHGIHAVAKEARGVFVAKHNGKAESTQMRDIVDYLRESLADLLSI